MTPRPAVTPQISLRIASISERSLMPSRFDVRTRLGLRPGTRPPSEQQLPVAAPANVSPDPAPLKYVIVIQRSTSFALKFLLTL
jgi:hypothetical protein